MVTLEVAEERRRRPLATDRKAIVAALDVWRDVAGRTCVNDRSTGAVIARPVLGDGPASGTGGQTGSYLSRCRVALGPGLVPLASPGPGVGVTRTIVAVIAPLGVSVSVAWSPETRSLTLGESPGLMGPGAEANDVAAWRAPDRRRRPYSMSA